MLRAVRLLRQLIHASIQGVNVGRSRLTAPTRAREGSQAASPETVPRTSEEDQTTATAQANNVRTKQVLRAAAARGYWQHQPGDALVVKFKTSRVTMNTLRGKGALSPATEAQARGMSAPQKADVDTYRKE
jgi:hypothetical protein